MTKHIKLLEDKPIKHFYHPLRNIDFSQESEDCKSFDPELTSSLLSTYASSLEVKFPEVPPSGKITNDAGKKLPFCKFYLTGFCNKSTSCPFRHDIIFFPQRSSEKLAEFSVQKNILLQGPSLPPSSTPNPENKIKTQNIKIETNLDSLKLSSNKELPLKKPFSLKKRLSKPDFSSITIKTPPNSPRKRPLTPPITRTRSVPIPPSDTPSFVSKLIDSFIYTGDISPILNSFLTISRDQNGCRFLQSLTKQTDEETFLIIFNNILLNFAEIATNAFGNYLCQKIIELVSSEELWLIIKTIQSSILVYTLDIHGTRVIQKILERLNTTQIAEFLEINIKGKVNLLAKDINGNHVIQKLLNLENVQEKDLEFIFEELTSSFFEIATHKHGCCVLQRCIDCSPIYYRKKMCFETLKNIFRLIQNSYGNYVVQYIVENSRINIVPEIMGSIEGNIVKLSKQKFSSNAIEKLLSYAGEREKANVINELIESGRLRELLEDSYANYVIQKAVAVCDKRKQRVLINAIKNSCEGLGYDSLGKKVCNKIVKKYEGVKEMGSVKKRI